MSELKAYKNIQPVFNTALQKDAVAADDYDGNEILFEESDEVYFKSEADKVISDLEESHKKEVGQLLIEIAELKKEKEYVIEHTAEVINGQECEIQRQKYKRCLAIAKWCDEVMMSCELRGYAVHRMWANRHQWAMRWKYKWLAIAEKLKEAK